MLDWIGFSQTSKSVANVYKVMQMNRYKAYKLEASHTEKLLLLNGAFTQSVLRDVIRHSLGHLNNKNIFFSKQTTILCGVICSSVNAT